MRKKTYQVPLSKVMIALTNGNILEASKPGLDFDEPGTGGVDVNPGEGHHPGEAFSNKSVWD